MYWVILRTQGKLYWKISSFLKKKKKKKCFFFENNHINIHLHYCKAIHGIINELLVIYIYMPLHCKVTTWNHDSSEVNPCFLFKEVCFPLHKSYLLYFNTPIKGYKSRYTIFILKLASHFEWT